MYRLLVFIFFIAFSTSLFAFKSADLSKIRKTARAYRIHYPPRINGMGDDSVWMKIPSISDFTQYEPLFGTQPSFRTEVKIANDDYAIYILATMFDPHSDSILRQLGNRDTEYLNADMFSIEFDNYNNQLDAYSFRVTASGVQLDSRKSDPTYDAVWDSRVRINKEGWTVELKIPYSALRFAKLETQIWGMQISRYIRRYRETLQWSLESLESSNHLTDWGLLQGIEKIEPPVRLSVTPYLMLRAEHFPNPNTHNDISTSIGGGMDIKYGFNEGFTLDMSLLPDFSQVKSDNKVKNLSAFETVYTEQRPFFREAVDLFKKGDIFYSRRIGSTPQKFYSITSSLNDNEELTKNPVQQRLLNATKFSGRNKHGLAIGVLNAITGNTYATARDSLNNERHLLTDPSTNYNVLVFDQALKNNSSIYIINTNVLRNKDFRKANVTASGLSLNNKTNTYQLNVSGGMSYLQNPANTDGEKGKPSVGYKYGIVAAKTRGRFLFSAVTFVMDDKFNANDLGVTQYNNYNLNIASVSYNFYKPFWLFRNMYNTLTVTNQNNNTTHKPQSGEFEYKLRLTTMKYLSVWSGGGYQFLQSYDYYEPRTAGMYYLLPKLLFGNLTISTDYRKTLAIDMMTSGYLGNRDGIKGFHLIINPIIRVNDHMQLNSSSEFHKYINNQGFATRSGSQVIFGQRQLQTVVNSLNGKYLFNENISLTLAVRHYYSRGKYDSFFNLLDNGTLQTNPEYSGNHDFNYNIFNVDMAFSWIFSPGSLLSLVWKNEISSEENQIISGYLNNFGHTLNEPQLNGLSLKVLYYFDYQRIKRKKHNSWQEI